MGEQSVSPHQPRVNMTKTDKNVPLPANDHRGRRSPKYPWKEMEINDSFFVPDKTSARDIKIGKTKAKCRVVDGGVRVWLRTTTSD